MRLFRLCRPSVPQTTLAWHDHLQQNHVNVLPWSTSTPDLPPTEHIWYNMEPRFQRYQVCKMCSRKLQKPLVPIWNNIPLAWIEHLIASARHRCLPALKYMVGIHSADLSQDSFGFPYCCSNHALQTRQHIFNVMILVAMLSQSSKCVYGSSSFRYWRMLK